MTPGGKEVWETDNSHHRKPVVEHIRTDAEAYDGDNVKEKNEYADSLSTSILGGTILRTSDESHRVLKVLG